MGRKKSKRNVPPEVVSRWQTYHGKGDLADWQRLMGDLGISGDFNSKTQCRKALATVWVNIHDFLDAIDKGSPVQFFPAQRELAQYTLKNSKIFPKRFIEKGSPLAALRAKIL